LKDICIGKGHNSLPWYVCGRYEKGPIWLEE
jgi:hypothetical protein